MKKTIGARLIAASMCALVLAGCGGSSSASYKDGTYTARSAERQADEDGNGSGYGEVTLTIRDNKVAECTYSTYELDGTLKDDSYGSDMTKENRMKAQKAVQSADKYAEMLVSAGSLDGVDAISGATINYEEFVEAVNSALGAAAE